jgi:hypothetical protein
MASLRLAALAAAALTASAALAPPLFPDSLRVGAPRPDAPAGAPTLTLTGADEVWVISPNEPLAVSLALRDVLNDA